MFLPRERLLDDYTCLLEEIGYFDSVRVGADTEFRNSFIVTVNLTTSIVRKETNLTNYNIDTVKDDIARLKLEKEEVDDHLDEKEEAIKNGTYNATTW